MLFICVVFVFLVFYIFVFYMCCICIAFGLYLNWTYCVASEVWVEITIFIRLPTSLPCLHCTIIDKYIHVQKYTNTKMLHRLVKASF